MLVSVFIIHTDYNASKAAIVKGDIRNGDITSFTAVQFGRYYKVYTDQDIELNPGDKVMLNGTVQDVINQTIPHTFDYKNYLLSKRIKSTIFSEDMEVVGHRPSMQTVRNTISNYIDTSAPLSGHYIKTFIIADSSGFDEEIQNDITILGVSHLFAVSGLHIGLLALVLDRGIKKYFPKITPQMIIIPLLIGYMVVTSFGPSVVRASLLYIGLFFNKKFKLEFSTLDVLSFIFIGYMIVSPYAIYSLGFSLSFLVTLNILLGNFILKDKSNIMQLTIISIVALLIALPITTTINHEINLLTIFVNTILIYGMSYVILPLGYVTFIIPFFDSLYYYTIQLYEKIIFLFSEIDFLRFDFVFVSHIQIVVYYILLILILSNYGKHSMKKYIGYMGVFLFLTMNVQLFNPIQSVSMIDVYGDSILIKDSFDRCNILVDTGVPDDYDSVIGYLKGSGIKRIDYFIVTHEDNDHKGERNDIHTNFDVMYEINSRSQVAGTIQCGGLEIKFYPFLKTYQGENNQSVVFTLNIANTLYLFTGDMESEREEEFVSLYDVDVDILKSPHHGSISSSTEQFLEDINPEEVWVSCYRKNTHNHPHPEVISRYEERNLRIYRTDLKGTIEQYYIFGFGYKKYHKP
jgi:competence protein ComEC